MALVGQKPPLPLRVVPVAAMVGVMVAAAVPIAELVDVVVILCATMAFQIAAWQLWTMKDHYATLSCRGTNRLAQALATHAGSDHRECLADSSASHADVEAQASDFAFVKVDTGNRPT